MAKISILACFLLLLAVSSASQEDQRRSRARERFQDLEPKTPREIFRSEGGRIEEWRPEEYPALCDAEVGARKVTLQQNGFALPSYKDSPLLKIITRGRCWAGIINPLTDQVVDRDNVLDLQKGDVVAVPRGLATWFYNDGNEECEILEIADTTDSPQCGRFRAFLLAGGNQEGYGSVLHGFSKDMVAHAWDVEEQMIEHMFEGRKDVAIIKADERTMGLPGRRTGRDSDRNSLFIDFVYRLKNGQPDIMVRNAGEARLLSSLKLPILKHVKLGAACVKMQEGALTAPGWLHNAHQVMYVEGGRGQVQVVRDNGEQALDTQLEEGQLLIIPANFPSVKRAEDEGFHYVGVATNDRPVESYLAGRNSVYQGMPRKVAAASFQIDERLLEKVAETRKEEAYLFPPRRQPRRGSFIQNLVGEIVV